MACHATTLLHSFVAHVRSFLLRFASYEEQVSEVWLAIRSSEGAKYGGGDGNRTHVHNTSTLKSSMLSLCLYFNYDSQRQRFIVKFASYKQCATHRKNLPHCSINIIRVRLAYGKQTNKSRLLFKRRQMQEQKLLQILGS